MSDADQGNEQSNQRQSTRQQVDFEAEFRVTGTEELETGRLRDLSAGGFLFSVGRELEPGTGLSVTLRSATSELVTAAHVLRCSSAGGQFEVACVFD